MPLENQTAAKSRRDSSRSDQPQEQRSISPPQNIAAAYNKEPGSLLHLSVVRQVRIMQIAADPLIELHMSPRDDAPVISRRDLRRGATCGRRPFALLENSPKRAGQ